MRKLIFIILFIPILAISSELSQMTSAASASKWGTDYVNGSYIHQNIETIHCDMIADAAIDILNNRRDSAMVNRHIGNYNKVLKTYRNYDLDTKSSYACNALYVSADNDITEIFYERNIRGNVVVDSIKIIQ